MTKRDDYIEELTKTLAELVSPDAQKDELQLVTSLPESCYISQLIIGDYTASTAVYAADAVMCAFATAYAGFDVSSAERDEVIADFLNMLNGRFAVRLSNTNAEECTLSVPVFTPPENVKLNAQTWVIPVTFSFGQMSFVFSE